MRAISVLIALARTATPALTNVSKLALGETQHAVVQPDSFADFVVYAEDDRDSLTFQMSASHALALYVVDGGVGEGLPQELGGALLSSDEVPFSTTLQATALDADTASHLIDDSASTDGLRRYYGYVSTCYILPGSLYYLRIHGPAALRKAAPFSLTAKAVRSEILLVASDASTDADPSSTLRGNASATVCDGKWMHHFIDLGGVRTNGAWDFTKWQASSRLRVSVRKTSGELTRFLVRYEGCATGSGSDAELESGRLLLGFGRSIETLEVPAARAGRYYVSIHGTTELCGDYVVHVTAHTQ